jgi:hypothetical protein
VNKSTNTFLKLAIWAGIIAPVIFVSVFTIEGWLRPGYDPLAQYVSALSLGPRGWVQIANFLIFGALLLVFSRGVAAAFPHGKASKGGLIILTILAFCFFFSGPFVMDPTGTPLEQSTVHGLIHGILGAVAFLLMPVSMFVYLRRFNSTPAWRSLRGWTLFLGSVSATSLVLLTFGSKFPQFQTVFAGWLGLIQRALIVPFMLWLFLFALELNKKNNRKDTQK